MDTDSSSEPLLWEALPGLTLNIAQTAALCGVSVRQLGYWTRQGYVAVSGIGARRSYGVEAIRRVLAIRKAMEAGASLRQALRQLPDAPMPAAAWLEPSVSSALPPASAVARSLAAFFAVNPHTRDHAGGLAVKLGWAEDDLRQAADSLCESGLLSRSTCQGMTIFHPAEKEGVHA